MQFVPRDEIDRCLDFPSLIDALAAAFSADFFAPNRHHYGLGAGANAATHLLMPAWTGAVPGRGAWLGTKIVNVFPGNAGLGLPAVHGVYVLQSGETGTPLAILDGTRLTHLRTAAASALAARFLARADASHLLMVGAGALAPCLVRAHASVRPISRVTLWNHRRESAERLARLLSGTGLAISVSDDLQGAVAAADIISCATLSQSPLIKGAWLRPGVHVDLVGAFNMAMRECDDAALLRARLYIDTPAALSEGGDVAVGLAGGVIGRCDVVADLAGLCRGEAQGRASQNEITLFKSVGAAIEDLAAAILVWERMGKVPA